MLLAFDDDPDYDGGSEDGADGVDGEGGAVAGQL